MGLAGAILRHERPDAVLSHSWRLLDHLDDLNSPVLTTIHYALDAEPYRSNFLARADATFVSISRSQQAALPVLRFAGNVYNGIDVESLPFRDPPDDYLAYLGRVSPDKGLEYSDPRRPEGGDATQGRRETRPGVAAVVRGRRRAARPPRRGRIAGRDFVHRQGAVSGRRGRPPPPVAVERAFRPGRRRGDGVRDTCPDPATWRRGRGRGRRRTGFVADREDGLSAAVERLGSLDRAACRRHVEAWFGRVRMAEGYERLAHEAASP